MALLPRTKSWPDPSGLAAPPGMFHTLIMIESRDLHSFSILAYLFTSCVLLLLHFFLVHTHTWTPFSACLLISLSLTLRLLLCLSLKLRVSHSIFYSACLFSCVSLTHRLLLCRPLKLRVSQYICPLLYNLQYRTYCIS